MVRKIYITGALNVPLGNTVNLPVGCRILSVNGECETKPTYDFTIAYNEWSRSAAAAQSYSIKYAGMRNGQSVNLMKDFPQLITIAGPVTATGDLAIVLATGAQVTLVVTYILSTVSP